MNGGVAVGAGECRRAQADALARAARVVQLGGSERFDTRFIDALAFPGDGE